MQPATEPDPEWVDDALLVISELVQNVSQHTRSAGKLIITIEPGAVLIEVGDTSTTVPQPRHPGPSQAGGRGLLLIDAISQQWGINTCPAGKAVWVRLATSPSSTRLPDAVASAYCG